MLLKLKSDRGFRDFIKGSKSGLMIGLVILFGLILILIGSFEGEKTAEGEEERLSQVCSMIDGVGECRAMIHYDDSDRVYSVILLCQGAESVSVRRDLTEAVCSLYGIGANRVEIFSLNQEYAEK